MISDLTTPKWSDEPGVPPKIKVERKEDVVARLGRSPDRGDAVVMVLWGSLNHTTGGSAAPQGLLPVTTLSPLA